MALGSPAEQKVRIVGLRKAFTVSGRTFEALAPIDLEVRSGELIGIVGPSGCGKTTMLRMLAGLKPENGRELRVETARGSPRPLEANVLPAPTHFSWMSLARNFA